MKIVKIQGGLGNQMFQYAFAKSLEQYGHDTYLDTSLYNNQITRGGINYTHNGFELEHLFNIEYRVATHSQITKLATLPTNIITRIKRKYLTKKTHYIDKLFKYTSQVLSNTEDTYLEGYWQSEKYFLPIQDSIKKDFVFKQNLSPKSKEVAGNNKDKHTVSIHVRRGDYLNSGIHDVCTKEYYNNAIAHCAKNEKIDEFLIFSNDIEWAKENLNFNKTPFIFVDWNTGENSWQDMYLMSTCPINIIANSSFSWWAAWLNSNKNKRVIAPSIWNRREIDYKDSYYTFDYSDVVPNSWERISI